MLRSLHLYQQQFWWFKQLERRKRRVWVYLKVAAFIMGFQQRHPAPHNLKWSRLSQRRVSPDMFYAASVGGAAWQLTQKVEKVEYFGLVLGGYFLKPSWPKNGSFLRIWWFQSCESLEVPEWIGRSVCERHTLKLVPYVSQRPVSLRYQDNYVPRQIVGPRLFWFLWSLSFWDCWWLKSCTS